ncbi:serine/threonine-protein kinase [Streptomyces sp. NPDC029216]|uniref:serine/threonine-protein kinase n=1 Tax=Streptomyces sp. NPDC029216 TaxID=3154701 RepID=UPI0033D08F3F
MWVRGSSACQVFGRTGAPSGGRVAEGARAGDIVGGRYELVQLIASGGMGRVWKAYDSRLQAEVALKELWLIGPMPPEQRAALVKRAELEALSAVRLRDHPNIVTVHDVVVEHDIPWIVMQLVSGGTLQQRLQQGPLEVPEVQRVAEALLHALAAAHRLGIVHRDVKPANVMLSDDGHILLADFGIAAPETGTGITSTGVVVGSAPYLAPERADGKPGRASSDLFSLGATLYEAVEGVSPFLRDSWLASAHAVKYEPAPPMRRAGALQSLIATLLAKDPQARPTIDRALTLLREAAKPQAPYAPTEAVTPPEEPDEDEGSEKAVLVVTNETAGPVRIHLGTEALGSVDTATTAIHNVEPTAARTMRVKAQGHATVSRVLQLAAGRAVKVTVRQEGEVLHLLGDGVPPRPLGLLRLGQPRSERWLRLVGPGR